MNIARKIILLIILLPAFMPSAHASYIPFNTNATGNIGIGSTNPGQKLDVQGTVRATGFVGNGSGLTGISSGLWATQNTTDQSLAGGNVGIGTTITNAGAALTVMNGNVGIGTWVPSSALQVNGSGVFSVNNNGGGTTPLTLSNSGSSGGSSVGMYFDVNNNTQEAYISADVSSNLNFGTRNPSGNITQVMKIDTNGNVGIGTYTPVGGLAVMNGNVGIGTWVPNNALAVSGNESLTGTLGSGAVNTSSVDIGYISTISSTPLIVGVGSGSGLALFENAGSVGSGTSLDFYANNAGASTVKYAAISGTSRVTTIGNEGGSLNFSTTHSGALTTQMVIDNNGNVGIGSLVPGQALDVVGTVRATNFVGNGSGLTGLSSGLWATQNTTDQSLAGGNVGIGTTITNAGAALTVMNGNVGIGTWVPKGSLEIEGGSVGIGTYNFYSSTTGPFALAIASNQGILLNGQIQWTDTNVIDFSDNELFARLYAGSEDTRFQSWNGSAVQTNMDINGSSGNIGIGTTTPMGGLTVMNGNVGIGTWVPGGGLVVMNGNVGIGTSSPSALFTVNGASILGSVGSSTDVITASGTGALAGGDAADAGHTGNITSTNNGSIAFGYSHGIGGAGNGSLVSSGQGSVAMGFAVAATLEATGDGSVALGYADGQNLEATGTASVAIGQNVQATADNAFALGESVVNNTASTFMVGFNNTTPTLTVTATNVGIGTFNPFGGGLIVTNGNVGIGSLTPGATLDVQGTVRATYFVGNGSGLTGISGSNYWLNTAGTGNVGISTTNTVGIGTTSGVGAGLVVMNGNVGIGTWKPVGGLIVLNGNVGIGYNSPGSPLSVNGITTASGFEENSSQSELAGGDLTLNSGGAVIWTNGGSVSNTNDTGLTRLSAGVLALGNGNASDTSGTLIASNIGIGTLAPKGALIIKTGNVGIGSLVPGQALDVQGTVRATNFVGNGSGLTGLSTGLWATQNTTDQSLTGGNVGIGTTITNAGAALSVMNGNVGIGTWIPKAPLSIYSTNSVNNVLATFSISDNHALIDLSSDTGHNSAVQFQQLGTPDMEFGYSDNGYIYLGTAGTDNGYLKIWNTSGEVETINNTLDDGSGNMILSGTFSAMGGDVLINSQFGNTVFSFTPQSADQAAEVMLNSDSTSWSLSSNGTSNTSGSGVFTLNDTNDNYYTPLEIINSQYYSLSTNGGDGDIVILGGYNEGNSDTIDQTSTLQVLGDANISGGLTVGGKLNENGGVDPPFVLLDVQTQAQIIDRMDYEVPVEKRSGLTLYWDGKNLNGLTVDADGNGTVYQIQMTRTGTFKMPNNYNTRSKNIYYWDAQTQSIKSMIIGVHDHSRDLPKGERVDHATGKIISMPKNQPKQLPQHASINQPTK